MSVSITARLGTQPNYFDPVHFIEVNQTTEDELVLLDNQEIFNQRLGGFLKNNAIITTLNFTK